MARYRKRPVEEPSYGRLPDADAILARLRELHTPVDNMAGRMCAGCTYGDPFEAYEWPCPTIRIVNGEDVPIPEL